MTAFIQHDARIFIAGHKGLVGSGLVRHFEAGGYKHLITRDRSDLDLTNESEVRDFMEVERPEVVIAAAAKVGGIKANVENPVAFLHDNVLIQCNLLRESWRAGVSTVVMLGSSCIYPRECPQPMREEHLMTGPLEPTNEGYALAKLSGLRLGQYYAQQHDLHVLNPIPCNVYGTNDHFDYDRAHVLSALVRRFVDAVADGVDEVVLWGTGTPRREFIHVDDLCAGLELILRTWSSSKPINLGPGEDVSIADLADLIARAADFEGEIRWDTSMPDGMARKCMDVSRVRELGFSPSISLEAGIARTIDEYTAIRAGFTP